MTAHTPEQLALREKYLLTLVAATQPLYETYRKTASSRSIC